MGDRDEQIRAKVELVIDRDGPADSIVQSYAWVRLEEPQPLSAKGKGSRHSRCTVMSVARAVMVTWAALAVCPGYGGSENGAFWKRVISELLKKQRLQRAQPARRDYWSPPRNLLKSVTDTHGFFDRARHAFPRFMVTATSEQDSAFDGLLTCEDSALNATVCAVLKSVLERLSPFMCRAPPTIDIRLQTCEACIKRDSGALVALVHAVSRSNTDQPSSAFRVCQIQLHDTIALGSDADVDAIVDFVQRVPVPVGHIRLTPLRDGPSRLHTARWFDAALRAKDHEAQVGSIDFARDDMNDTVFQALASALPFATSTHSLGVDATSYAQHGRFEQFDLPWIAYAIFHPQAKASSWRRLGIKAPPLTERGANVMAAMARGNNLLALLNGSASESDAYYSARLLKGAIVKAEADASSDAVFIVASDDSTNVTVDICGILSLDPATWGEWVAVIVPAYGLGWVRAHELHSVTAHSPSQACLSGLHLLKTNVHDAFDDHVRDALGNHAHLHLGALVPLAPTLTFLDIGSYSNLATPVLRELLHACPMLKVLVVSYAGELWSQPLSGTPNSTTTSRLEELELLINEGTGIVVPTRKHIDESSCNLRALRVVCVVY